MKLAEVVRKECVEVGAHCTGKEEALQQIARIAARSPMLDLVSQEDVLDGLKRREELGSTGFGEGIAIPHCRLEGVSDFVLGIVTIPQGVEFDAIDGEKVNIIIFIIAPRIESEKHVKLLSAISQILLVPGTRKEMLAQTDREGLYESFLRHTVNNINGREDQKDKSLVQVFIQDEATFKDILQVLAGIESSSVVALDAENASAYLAKLPLFAEFWTDEPGKFCRIVVAVVEQGLVNETIRRIETVTGDLNQAAGVMAIVQPISYAAGSLNA